MNWSVVGQIFHLYILRTSPIGGCLNFKHSFILIWSPNLMFKIWGRSGKLLMIYSTFNILRSSSIGGHLHVNYFCLFWFGPLSLSSRLDEGLISGCWDILYKKMFAVGRVGGWVTIVKVMPLCGPYCKSILFSFSAEDSR